MMLQLMTLILVATVVGEEGGRLSRLDVLGPNEPRAYFFRAAEGAADADLESLVEKTNLFGVLKRLSRSKLITIQDHELRITDLRHNYLQESRP